MAAFSDQVTASTSHQDYDFVNQPDQDYFCPVTLELLSEPQQTSCCGQHLSLNAANRLTKGHMPCPLCKKQFFTTNEDKWFQRKVKELKVRCPYKTNGCFWIGEFGDLKTHSVSCTKRSWTCPFCSLVTKYDAKSAHSGVCHKTPVQCPNHCEIGTVPRCDTQKHLLACPLQLVECKFAEFGCKEKVHRNDLANHVRESAVNHLMDATLLNLQLTKEIHKKMEEKDEQIRSLQTNVAKLGSQIDDRVFFLQQDGIKHSTSVQQKVDKSTTDIQASIDAKSALVQDSIVRSVAAIQQTIQGTTSSAFCSHTFVIDNYSLRKQEGIINPCWDSGAFFCQNYKISLCIFLNGSTTAVNTHLSPFLCLWPGDFDGRLKWPIQCVVHLQMVNQEGDHSHRSVVGLVDFYEARINLDETKLIGTSYKFFRIDQLSVIRRVTQGSIFYLKNDSLIFKMDLKIIPQS